MCHCKASAKIMIKYAVATKPTMPGDVASILDQNAEDKWGLSIEVCNEALVPDLELLNLVKEKYTWAGMNVTGPKEFEYDERANENWSLVDYQRNGPNRTILIIVKILLIIYVKSYLFYQIVTRC